MFQVDKSFNDFYKVGAQLGSGAFSLVVGLINHKQNKYLGPKF